MKKLLIVASGIALLMTGCDEVKDKDGNAYKTVKIGNQVWMAENLNIKTEGSWCYDDNPANCEKYGRLYTLDAAKSACPEGWHLPSNDEWDALFYVVGGKTTAGKKLKSTSGWNEDGNGTDEFEFSVFPAGFRDKWGDEGRYERVGEAAAFWSTSEVCDKDDPCIVGLLYKSAEAYLDDASSSDGFSVRCLKD